MRPCVMPTASWRRPCASYAEMEKSINELFAMEPLASQAADIPKASSANSSVPCDAPASFPVHPRPKSTFAGAGRPMLPVVADPATTMHRSQPHPPIRVVRPTSAPGKASCSKPALRGAQQADMGIRRSSEPAGSSQARPYKQCAESADHKAAAPVPKQALCRTVAPARSPDALRLEDVHDLPKPSARLLSRRMSQQGWGGMTRNDARSGAGSTAGTAKAKPRPSQGQGWHKT